MNGHNVGTLLDSRYLIVQSRILLDTKPGNPPLFTKGLNQLARHYAELFSYKAYIPQIYGYLQHQGKFYELLENSAIYPFESTTRDGQCLDGQLMPDLASVWESGSLEHQISWIVQILGLWHSLESLGLTRTLFNQNLIRVDSDRIRILSLETNQRQSPSIDEFIGVWGNLLNWKNTEFWSNLLHKVIQGQITNINDILALLDHEIKIIQIKTTGSHLFDIDIATLTDCGPSRTENQDACYPDSKTYLQLRSRDNPYLVVCDGVGGHEGGSFASKLAITTIEQYLSNIDLENCVSDDITTALEKAIVAANDVICDRNDRENRHEKQRMGTTVVLAYIRQNQLFITHVGDSRVYRITSTGCHQLTVDDDVASREAMYGTAFYRESLQYSGTGALTQALGTSGSAQLCPKTQRFYLTGPCLFLLCSDGLSDFDLVDRIWATTLKPVLYDRTQLLPACEHLVEIANARNGHDNVTVGLLHIIRPELQIIQQSSGFPTLIAEAVVPSTPTTQIPKTRVATVAKRSNWLKTSLFSLLLFGILGGLGLALWRSRQQSQPDATVSPTLPRIVTVDVEKLQQVNQILQVKPSPVPLSLLPKPDPNSQQVPIKIGNLAPGTIVQVKSQLTTKAQENWVMLKVCSVPPESSTEPVASLAVGTEGWQRLKQVAEQVTLPSVLPPQQLGNCIPPQAVPSPTPPLTDRSPTDSPATFPASPNQAQ
jgi:serine/threonine protein phosphatase PrpC